MCRIFVSNAEFIKSVFGKQKTEDFFKTLENDMGGDGNGVYTTATGGIIKGVNMSAAMAAGFAYGIATYVHGSEIIAFHTRLASAGIVTADNNHPIAIDEKRVLLHNGTLRDWKKIDPDAGSDTNAVAGLIRKFGVNVLTEKIVANSGVWVVIEMGHEHHTVTVVRRGGYGIYMYTKHADKKMKVPAFVLTSKPLKNRDLNEVSIPYSELLVIKSSELSLTYRKKGVSGSLFAKGAKEKVYSGKRKKGGA